MKANRNTIREQNELIVLSAIINHPYTSRATISHDSKLNKATVSEIVKKLITENLVVELGTGISTSVGGRKPVLLRINANAGYAMSLAITQTKIASLVCDLQGTIIDQHVISRKIEAGNVLDTVEESVLYHKKKLRTSLFGVVGIVLSIDGIVHDDEIVFSTNKMLEHLTTQHFDSLHIDSPIYMENKDNLSALAESTFAASPWNIVSVSLGETIGSGILIDDHLYRGSNSFAGDLGHVILYPFGKECRPVLRGCLNQYCSTEALLAELRERKGDVSLKLEDLIALYRKQDEDALAIIQTFTDHMSIAISNVVSFLDPEKIYLNGQLFREIPEIVPAIREQLDQMHTIKVPLVLSTLGENAALLGGIAFALQNFFQIPGLHLHSGE